MTAIKIQPLHKDFGARLTGMDLSVALNSETLAELHQAIDEYSLICLPNQNMSDDIQLSFTRQLGEPEADHITFGKTGQNKYVTTVGNIDESGQKSGNAHQNTKFQKGNNLWHSDSSFRQTPSYVSIMFPHEVPDEGGITEFVSQRVAYNRLSSTEQSECQPYSAIHDYVFSRTQIAPVDFNHAASLPPVKHPLVRTNDANQQKNLYIGAHARSVVGLNGIQSRILLDSLLEKTTTEESIFPHQWQAGEVVIWDNRCLLHRGTGYDADRWRRRMRQSRVVGSHSGII
ncbi:MAG: alpha-ketoglutarate-dependent 2,4-dichlorophenoxyacetate dioxygenase [Parasphingorhabdus sp.]|jgi:alpha-ketoglutarate-dependent 2,4-dichlorophenoxyacetate dioxygenase